MKSKTRSTFYTSLFIIALVLFFLNLFTAGAIYSNLLLEDAQEHFELMVELPDYAAADRKDALGEFLAEQPFVKEMRYISKSEAGKIFVEGAGEDFMEMMDGTNPLPASYNFTLHSTWVNSDSLEGIHALIAGRTAIVVAHRLSSIQDVDRIYVLEMGRIVEAGAHDELLALAGVYEKLYRLQYAGQRDAAAAAAGA